MGVKYKGLWNVGTVNLIFFIFLIGIASGSSVSIVGEKHYSEGDTVTVKVRIDKGIENAIKSIELHPSPESWPSQTLHSGGKIHWGSSISRKAGSENVPHAISKEVQFVIPSNRTLENQTVKLTFEVEYYYAELLRGGAKEHVIIGERNFENEIGSENFDLDLKIYSPEEKQRLIEERKETLLEKKEKEEAFVRKAALYLVILIPITFFFMVLLIGNWGENMSDFVTEAFVNFFVIVLLIEIILLLIFGILALLTLF